EQQNQTAPRPRLPTQLIPRSPTLRTVRIFTDGLEDRTAQESPRLAVRLGSASIGGVPRSEARHRRPGGKKTGGDHSPVPPMDGARHGLFAAGLDRGGD